MSCHAPLKVHGRLVACAYCPGCRSKRSASWAIRLEDQQIRTERSCFLTLTIRDDIPFCFRDAPSPGRVTRRDLQLFFKRLRKRGAVFKYYAIGEYGEKSARAHYHVLLFGLDDRDRVTLESCWPWGHIDIGRVESASVRYVTGYVMKAPLGRLRLHEERIGACPPFSTMSKGLGAVGREARRHTLVTQGVIRVGSKAVSPPRYYTAGLSESDKQAFLLARRARGLAAAEVRLDLGAPYISNDVRERAKVSRADYTARQKPRGYL